MPSRRVKQACPVHFTHCIRQQRILITGNHDDFELLHYLVRESKGNHPGILAIRKDNTPRDMTAGQVVRAIDKLQAAGVALPQEFIILNHWR